MNPLSKQEAEDLLYAILTREQALERIQQKAWKDNNGAITNECIREQIRLEKIRIKIERYVGKHKDRKTMMCTVFPDWCSTTSNDNNDTED